MINSDYEIIQIFKRTRNLDSDNKAAKAIGISRTVISDIRNNRKEISENIVRRMAKIAGEPIATAWGERCKRRIMNIM